MLIIGHTCNYELKTGFLKIICTYMDASFLATIGLIVMEFMLPLSLSFDYRQITLLHIDLIILHGDLIILHGEASVYDE